MKLSKDCYATLRVKCKLLSWLNLSDTLAPSASIIFLLSTPHPHPEHSTLVPISGPWLGWPVLSPNSPHLSGHSLSTTSLSCPPPQNSPAHLSALYSTPQLSDVILFVYLLTCLLSSSFLTGVWNMSRDLSRRVHQTPMDQVTPGT